MPSDVFLFLQGEKQCSQRRLFCELRSDNKNKKTLSVKNMSDSDINKNPDVGRVGHHYIIPDDSRVRGERKMKKTKRLLSLFLCLLMLVSVFAVDASAIQYVGGDSTISSASSGSSGGFAIWDGNLGNQFYIVGYRFSAINSKGNTLTTNDGKSRVIDLIRFGEYKEGSSIVKWGTSAYDTNRMAGDMRETRWLTTRNNKFQWAQTYKKGSGSISVKTTTGTSADDSTMGPLTRKS